MTLNHLIKFGIPWKPTCITEEKIGKKASWQQCLDIYETVDICQCFHNLEKLLFELYVRS